MIPDKLLLVPRAGLVLALIGGCGESREPVAVELQVVVSEPPRAPSLSDLGYAVSLTDGRAAIRDIEFTILGEEHASLGARLRDWLVPSAHAHPGHAAGGAVTGELRGELLVPWMDAGAALGTGTLLTGRYRGANFTFRRAGAEDGLDPGDPLFGHTFHLEVVAERGEDTWQITILLDFDDDTQLIGAPFDLELTETTESALALELALTDPFAGKSAFDGVDFAALDPEGTGVIVIEPGQADHNRLRRALSSHDHYLIVTR